VLASQSLWPSLLLALVGNTQIVHSSRTSGFLLNEDQTISASSFSEQNLNYRRLAGDSGGARQAQAHGWL
jgi:hypothetical protein